MEMAHMRGCELTNQFVDDVFFAVDSLVAVFVLVTVKI
jgi:hypothetical protein